MIAVLLLICLTTVAASLRPGSGSVTVETDKPNYETGQTILVTVGNAQGIPTDEVRARVFDV